MRVLNKRERAVSAAYYRRVALAAQGVNFPDPRNQEQRDLGVVLLFRQRLAKRDAVSSVGHYKITREGLRFVLTARGKMKLPKFLQAKP